MEQDNSSYSSDRPDFDSSPESSPNRASKFARWLLGQSSDPKDTLYPETPGPRRSRSEVSPLRYADFAVASYQGVFAQIAALRSIASGASVEGFDCIPDDIKLRLSLESSRDVLQEWSAAFLPSHTGAQELYDYFNSGNSVRRRDIEDLVNLTDDLAGNIDWLYSELR